MQYGIEIVPFGEYADPRLVVKLALAAEAAGWEALYLWDHIGFSYGVGDPWVILSAVAQATEHIKMVVGVAPLPRYKPHLLWRMTTGLDLLSQGRLILGAGIGGMSEEFSNYGEPGDPKIRAAMMEEGLELLTRMWTGETVEYLGEHYSVMGVAHRPVPVQQPRITTWIGGESKPALRRAARWDGWIIGAVDENSQVTKTPAELAEQVAYIRQHRVEEGPFDIAIDGITSGAQDRSLVRGYEEAGATWYFEILFGLRGSQDEMLERIHAGPPGRD